jgi:hypothetical protein
MLATMEGEWTVALSLHYCQVSRLRIQTGLSLLSNMASLENAVHPLLTRDKFAKHVNYAKVFLQPARLVTRMLATPQAEHYFLALITNSKHRSRLRGAAKDLRHRYWSDKKIGELSSLDRQCVRTWLCKIADVITYSVRGCDGALAETEKLPLSSSENAMGRSLICISRSEHYNPLHGELPPRERIIRQFNLAVALLHELAHAISYAVTGREEEDFFEDSIVAEAGFEFEAQLFGACPSFSSSAPKVVKWFPWPSRILLAGEGDVESYDLEDLCSNSRKLVEGAPIAKVSIGFIKNLFRGQFWQKVVAKEGPVAVLAPEIRDLQWVHVRRPRSIQRLLAMAPDKKVARIRLLERRSKCLELSRGRCRAQAAIESEGKMVTQEGP